MVSGGPGGCRSHGGVGGPPEPRQRLLPLAGGACSRRVGLGRLRGALREGRRLAPANERRPLPSDPAEKHAAGELRCTRAMTKSLYVAFLAPDRGWARVLVAPSRLARVGAIPMNVMTNTSSDRARREAALQRANIAAGFYNLVDGQRLARVLLRRPAPHASGGRWDRPELHRLLDHLLS